MYWRGCGVARDLQRAEQLYAEACRLGSIGSCGQQAYLFLEREPGRLAEGEKLYRHSCAAGNTRSCSNLGLILATRDPRASGERIREGIRLTKQACTADSSFCEAFGHVVVRHQTAEEFDAAREALRRSCKQGAVLSACHALAVALEDGDLGVTDHGEGADLAARACESGHLPSCNALAHMFHRGHGFPKDDVRAAALFYFACTKGLAASCEGVGEMTENGWGVERDLAKAIEFYEYACSLHPETGCERAKTLRAGAESPPQEEH